MAAPWHSTPLGTWRTTPGFILAKPSGNVLPAQRNLKACLPIDITSEEFTQWLRMLTCKVPLHWVAVLVFRNYSIYPISDSKQVHISVHKLNEKLKMKDIKTKQFVQKEKPFASVLAGFSEAFVSGKFCDVKVVCKVLWWFHHLQNFIIYLGHQPLGSPPGSRISLTIPTQASGRIWKEGRWCDHHLPALDQGLPHEAGAGLHLQWCHVPLWGPHAVCYTGTLTYMTYKFLTLNM